MRAAPLLTLLAFAAPPPVGQLEAQTGRPAAARTTGTFEDPRLTESSGVAVSRRHQGLLWTINDSGEPLLFLTDTLGRTVGAFTVRGAAVVDWEALALGPCGRERGGDCLYIADTGDNAENRESATLYRIPEPDRAAPDGLTAPAEQLDFFYQDGSPDVEAIVVEQSGDVLLIAKGRSRGALVFRLPATAWGRRSAAAAIRTDSLPIPTSLLQLQLVTDAALAPDGEGVAVRTYREVHFFRRAGDGRLRADPVRPVCQLGDFFSQGEGLAWWDEETLVLTSETGLFRRGAITLVRCPRQ